LKKMTMRSTSDLVKRMNDNYDVLTRKIRTPDGSNKIK